MQVRASENFRRNLRSVMQERSISQRALAEKAGISYPYLNRVLTGLSVPSIEVADLLADNVGIPLGEMILSPVAFSNLSHSA